MKLLYLHGFRTESSGKVKKLRTMFPTWTVEVLNYEPHNPESAEKSIDDYMKKNKESVMDFMVIGTSLGGFWARYMTGRYAVSAVLINPSLNPDMTLPLGKFDCYDTGKEITVSKKMLADFEKYKCNGYMYFTAIAMDDEVINPHDTIAELAKSGREAKLFPKGGHRFNNLMPLKQHIERLRYTLPL